MKNWIYYPVNKSPFITITIFDHNDKDFINKNIIRSINIILLILFCQVDRKLST